MNINNAPFPRIMLFTGKFFVNMLFILFSAAGLLSSSLASTIDANPFSQTTTYSNVTCGNEDYWYAKNVRQTPLSFLDCGRVLGYFFDSEVNVRQGGTRRHFVNVHSPGTFEVPFTWYIEDTSCVFSLVMREQTPNVDNMHVKKPVSHLNDDYDTMVNLGLIGRNVLDDCLKGKGGQAGWAIGGESGGLAVGFWDLQSGLERWVDTGIWPPRSSPSTSRENSTDTRFIVGTPQTD